MALTLSQIGIETSNTVEAWHVTQSIDAFTGTEAYDISLSGSLDMTGPVSLQGSGVSINSPSITITDNYSPTSLSIQTTLTDDSTITSNTGTEINFHDAGNGSTGYFRIPIAQTSNGGLRAGMMYWDDASGNLYIYSENTSAWMSASFA
jgi:hypothetical protein